jgi:hypothetical protein
MNRGIASEINMLRFSAKIYKHNKFNKLCVFMHQSRRTLEVQALITVRATSSPVYPSARRGGLRGAGGRSTACKIAENIDCGF